MDATANFSLRFARPLESKIETTGWVLSRQVLQRIATRVSLVGEAIGFSILGILILMNRHQAELNGLSGGSTFAMVGGVAAFLLGTVFLGAALFPLEVLCQPSSHAAGQASVGPFHFR